LRRWGRGTPPPPRPADADKCGGAGFGGRAEPRAGRRTDGRVVPEHAGACGLPGGPARRGGTAGGTVRWGGAAEPGEGAERGAAGGGGGAAGRPRRGAALPGDLRRVAARRVAVEGTAGPGPGALGGVARAGAAGARGGIAAEGGLNRSAHERSSFQWTRRISGLPRNLMISASTSAL